MGERLNDQRNFELEALNKVLAALKELSDEDKERVLRTASTFFGMSSRSIPTAASIPNTGAPTTSFSEDRTISAKEFLIQKQPKTDIERVACLAYYLTQYQDIPHFKTLDISKLNTEAAQPKFSNTAFAVENATKRNFLVQASKGNKQISAQGELFVQALPDRDAAKAVMATIRPRRKKKLGLSNTDSGANE